MPGGPVPAVAGLDREAGIALLDRAAEVGLLTAHGDGYYAVHPAIPWHLHTLFTRSTTARTAAPPPSTPPAPGPPPPASSATTTTASTPKATPG